MPIIGIRESTRVVGWAITRVNSELDVKHIYAVVSVPNKPFIAVASTEAGLLALQEDLTGVAHSEFINPLPEYLLQEVKAILNPTEKD